MSSAKVVSPTFHYLVLWVMLCFVTVVILAFIFEVEIVARGEGKVVPLNQVQLVQSEFSGQIQRINVKNGDKVEEGDVLIELNDTEVKAEIAKIKLEIEQLDVELARINEFLAALLLIDNNGNKFDVSINPILTVKDEIKESVFFNSHQQLYEAEIIELSDQIKQFEQRVISSQSSIQVVQSEIERTRIAIINQDKRLKASNDLVLKGLVSLSDHLNIKETFDTLKLDEQLTLKRLQQASSLEREIIAEYRSYISSRRSLLFNRMTEIKSLLATLHQSLMQSNYVANSKKLKAPINGFVDQLSVFTIGGVSQAGAELVKVVPSDHQVIIEAIFKNVDIGFLEVGQQANIKLEAFPSERFGFVKGQVKYVSADALQGPDDEWGFLVQIALNAPYLQTRTEEFLLKPGMTATIDIITGKRKIISYFFAPIIKNIEYSLGER